MRIPEVQFLERIVDLGSRSGGTLPVWAIRVGYSSRPHFLAKPVLCKSAPLDNNEADSFVHHLFTSAL